MTSGLYTIQHTYSGVCYGTASEGDLFGNYRFGMSASTAPEAIDVIEWKLKEYFRRRLVRVLYANEDCAPHESPVLKERHEETRMTHVVEDIIFEEEQDSDDDDSDEDFIDEEEHLFVQLGKRPSPERSTSPPKRVRVDKEEDDTWTPNKPASSPTRVKRTVKPNPKRRTKIDMPSTPIQCKEARLAIILSPVGDAQLKRAHLHEFYSSLQPGPQQLQMLGELDHHLSRDERIAYMSSDKWIVDGSLQRWEVQCRGCDKVIKLEGPRKDREAKVRNPKALKKDAVEFYPGNWNKHRNQCRGVYKVWCEANGLVPDEGRPAKGKKLAGRKAEQEREKEDKVRELRPVKALPTRNSQRGGRRTSLASMN